MLRLGAAISDRIPLMVAPQPDKGAILDHTPGWVGDESLKSLRYSMFVFKYTRLSFAPSGFCFLGLSMRAPGSRSLTPQIAKSVLWKSLPARLVILPLPHYHYLVSLHELNAVSSAAPVGGLDSLWGATWVRNIRMGR